MKSVIICEGGTDLALIQYFMEKTHQWSYVEEKNEKLHSEISRNKIRAAGKQQIKWFKKEENYLAIYSVGGVSRIDKALNTIIEINRYRQMTDEPFEKVIIITDKDEVDSIGDFEDKINKVLDDNGISGVTLINDQWRSCFYQKSYNDEVDKIELLLLVIPFEETGALETFLLDALSKNNATDKKIIEQGNSFIDNLDSDNKYLKHRRHKTKAKFDVYFSIRTPLEQFKERRDILRSINWEEYETIQESFVKLGELT